MPGIFGVVSAKPGLDLAALVAEMAGRLRHYPWYVEDRHVDAASGLALARTSLGVFDADGQPARNEDGSLLAVMGGELYDADGERRALAASGHAFRGEGHAEVLVHGYEAHGRAFFRRLNGVFAAAIWDARSRELILVNDRFGMKPLYYAARPGRLVFAPEIKAVLADPGVPRGVSARGVAQFFHFGQNLGDDTLLESVRTLPPAGWLTYRPDDDRLTLDRYWRLDEAGAEGGRVGEAEALDRIDEAFQRAVDRRTGGKHALGLSLSGGLDSRTILAAADTGRAPLTTVSVGIEGSLDHVSARRMSGLAGCPHHEYHLGAGFLAAFETHLRRMAHLTDGQYLCQCVVMPSLPFYRELGVDVLLRGHAGELLHMNKAYNFSLDPAALALRDDDGLERWLFGRMSDYMMGSVTDDLFAAPAGGLARESLRECLEESSGVDPLIHRVWHLFLSQRLRRETALSLAEFGSVTETRLPYLDNDLIDALLAAPPGLKLGDRIQSHILRRRRPEFLGVVNSNTGARVGAGRLERSLAEVRLKVLAKLGVRGYQPYERLGAWLRGELRPLVRRLLLTGPLPERGVFRPEAVRSVVEQHLGGRRNHTFLLLALMIFEVGQRQLIDGAGEVSDAEAAGPAHSGFSARNSSSQSR